jgi:hypothetical protein
MRLSQGSALNPGPSVQSDNNSESVGVKKDSKATNTDKLKASNFPASLLKIGGWEYKSRYEGDLVAKCYFAKHKLVWEVLDGGLKSKIEIQWSDIMGLKANFPENESATLNVVLARQPLFFRETNPQPRKHTLWQATADFTDGQTSLHRLHFLQCPHGLLNKHFEKLIQCDVRLNFLSRQPEITLDSPYFEPHPSFNDPSDSKGFDHAGKSLGVFQELSPPTAAHSSSLEIDNGDPSSIISERTSREAPSPSSGSEAVNSKGPRNWDHVKVPGLHPSMSMTDFMNHIGNHLSEQMTAGNPSVSANATECQNVLEDIAQYLLSDTQFTTASDEKGLMSRVDSLCCLLQKDGTSVQNLQAYGESFSQGPEIHLNPTFQSTMLDNRSKAPEEGITSSRPMSRKDSFTDMLLHLPQIASLPKFLFNISEEDGGSQAR